MRTRTSAMRELCAALGLAGAVAVMAGLATEPASAQTLPTCKQDYAAKRSDYRLRFGDIPRQEVLDLLGSTGITVDQARLLRHGMELLVGYLAIIRAWPTRLNRSSSCQQPG